MNKQEVLDVIKKNLVAAVDNVTVDQIDAQKTMSVYGASSLDIVEVVSNSMRQLKIKVPRTELTNIKNIDGVVELFCKYANQG